MPCDKRVPSNCHTLATLPESAMKNVIATQARTSIGLRPMRSERLPHIGDVIVAASGVTETTIPDQIATIACDVMPRLPM